MLLTLLLPFTAHAADDVGPLVTDRPDIAESSLAVGPGTYQLEQGVIVRDDGGTLSVGLPSLSRYGIGHGLELRLETPIVSIAGGTASFDTLALGAKWHLPTGGPSLGLLAHAEFDANGDVVPIVKVACDLDLPAGLELGVNVGATTAPALAQPTALWAAAVGRPLNDKLRVYVEGSGDAPVDGGDPTVAVDGGFSYLFSDDVQWDLSALYGAVGGGWSAGSGLSVRFD